MKAVLSNRIYVEVTPAQEAKIREELTYTIPTYGDSPDLIIRDYAVFRPGIMTIPIGRVDLIPEGHEIVEKRIAAPIDFPEFRGELREGSQAFIGEDVSDNCLINAKVGFGKTATGLYVAGRLALQTLVTVHTLPLMYQWAEEVEKFYGFTPDMVGGGKEGYSTPIVLGNVASLERRMPQIARRFGTVILDEVHHAPSRTFTKVIDGSYARYKIGLSGTLERKDGLHVLLPNYFGQKVYKPAVENTVPPEIHAYGTGIFLPQGGVWAHRVSELKANPYYQQWIVDCVKHYESLGHKVLLVSDRVEFLKLMQQRLDCAMTIGETQDRQSELEKIYSGQKSTMAGTLQIWKEGISCNPLSCVILATPINNEPMLEQLIGRVQRLHPGKLPPVVVDPILQGPTPQKQFLNRIGFYMRQGWSIKYL